MSKTVDERVVEMRFDNKQFENNVQNTMSTLDKLKAKLNFKGVEKGFENISAAASSCDISPIGKAAEVVHDKFSALEVMGITALANITNSAIDTGKQLIKSLSIDNISAGWDKFADKTTSVATLVAQGFDLETVNEQLERLNWFTDETSYNFVDMVGEIGKFTASGQDLEASVTAMEGIASWAALSGQNATKASQAMYQLSQAMGKGALKYDDWKSIQNASMDTVEFRRQAAQAAIDLGQMKKAVDETGKELEDYYQIIYENEDTKAIEFGDVVSLNDLFTSDYLTQEAWLDTDVMMKVFDQYGKAAKVIQKYTDSFDFDTASEAMSDLKKRAEEYIKTMKAAGKDVSLDEALRKLSLEDMKQDAGILEEATEYMNEFNASVEPENMIDLDEAIRALGYELDEFSLKAFEAGQQARTWADVIDSVKDAVSTGWMNTFQNIFGDYEEAKTLWTDLANELYDVFAESGNQRNEMLAMWKQMNGRNLLFANDEDHITGAFWNLFYAITDVANVIKEAFRDIFKGMDAQKLYDMTASLYFFAQKLRMTDETADKLKRTFKGLFAAVDIVFMLIKSAANAIFKVVGSLFGKTDKSILDTTASIGDSITAFHDWLKEGDVFGKAFDKISEAISRAIEWVKGFIDYVRQLPAVQDAIEKVKNFFSSIVDGIDIADISIDNFGQFLELLRTNIVSGFDSISEAAKKSWKKVVEFAVWAKEKLDKIGIGNIGAIAVGAALILFAKKIANATGLLESPLEELGGLFKSLSKVLKGFSQDLKAHALIKIAGAIALLAGAVAVLAFINPEGLWNAVGVLGALAAGLLGFSILLSKFSSGEFKLSASVVAIAAAVTILVGAFAKLDEVNGNNIGRNIAVIGGLAAGITILGSIIGSASKNGSKAALAMIGMSAALLLMIHAIRKIAEIDTADLAKGIIVIGILTLYLKAVRAVFKQTQKGAKAKIADNAGLAMVGMAAAMLLMIAAIKKIGATDTGILFKGIAVIAALTLFTAILVQASKSSGEYAAKAGLMMLGMSAALLIVTSFIKQIADIPSSALTRAALVAAGLLAVFALITSASALAGENAAKAGVMMIGMSVALLAMSGVLAILTDANFLNSEGLIRALAGVGVLGVFVVGLGALIVGLGELFEHVEGLEATFDTGIRILEKVGYGLGAFVGSIIGGLAAGITNGLPQIGENIAEFGGNIEPFLTQMSSIDDNALTGIGILSDMILKLAAADFLDGITSIVKVITGQKDASSFGEELVLFADSIAGFAEKTKNINGTNFKNVSEGALALADFANHLPAHDGLVQWITGEKYLDKFGNELNAFAPSLVEYAKQVSQIENMDVIGTSATAASALSEFANQLPAHEGILQAWIGESYLSAFGREIKEFAPLLVEYADTVKDLDSDSIDKSVKAADIIREFATALPSHGGIIKDWFTGDATLTSFGEELASFGPKLMEYADNVKGLDKDVVDNSVNAAKVLAAFEKEDLQSTGGLMGWLNGTQDLGAFGEKLPKLGEGLKTFSDTITANGGINKSAVDTAAKALEVLAALQNNIPEEEGFFDKIGNFFNGGGSGIDTFTSNMPKLAEGIKNFSDALTANGGINDGSVDAAANTFAALSQISQITNIPNIGTVTNKLPEIAEDLRAYSDKLNEGTGFNTETMNEIVASVKSLYDLESELTATGFENTTEGINEMLNSPSRVFYGIGEFAGQGFVNALDDYSKASYNSGLNIADSAVNGLSGTIQRLADHINSDIDTEPTIRPVLDLSDIDEGVSTINGMFASQRSIELAGRASFDMNAAVSKNQNGIIVDNKDVVTAVKDLRGEMSDLVDKFSKLQIVLNTGALVGELASPMDTAIGVRASRSVRGRG